MPGGGGYGDPHDRDPAMIAADIDNGFVTAGRRGRHTDTRAERRAQMAERTNRKW